MYSIGKHDFRPKKGREKVAQWASQGVVVTAEDIPKYCNDDFYIYLGHWQIFKILGSLPNGNIGWGNEPEHLIMAFLAFASEQNLIDNEEMEKTKKRSKTGSKGVRR